jgi:hypothetical protein
LDEAVVSELALEYVMMRDCEESGLERLVG